MISRILSVLICCNLLGTHLQAEDCPVFLSKIAGITYRSALRPVGKYVLTPTGKTLYYPLFVPKLAYDFAKIANGHERGQFVKDVLKKDSVPFALFLAQFVLSQGMITTLNEMDNASDAGDIDADKDVVVYVNAFHPEDDENFFGLTEKYFKTRYGKAKKAVYINPKDLEEFLQGLEKIKAEMGPIKRLEFYGHGNRSGIIVGRDGIGKNLIGKNASRMKNDALFTGEAQIVLNTCWVESTPRGHEFVEKFGNTMLSKGGTVYATKTTFVGSPNALMSLMIQPLLAYRAVNELLYEEESKFQLTNKIVTTPIEVPSQ